MRVITILYSEMSELSLMLKNIKVTAGQLSLFYDNVL